MKKKILVSGSSGQLGEELKFITTDNNSYEMIFKTRVDFDLSSESSIKQNLSEPYDVFINAAAYTAVDKAEEDRDACYSINAKALDLIGQYASPLTKIIHLSTDYVYHGHSKEPLTEIDNVNPQSVYAKSKLRGEEYLLDRRPDAIIIRSSWLFSSFGHNFVKTILRLGLVNESINVVSDQIGSPTYVRDLARVILLFVKSDHSGIYNYTNDGIASWADFARKIFDLSSIKCIVNDIATENYNARAKRPYWSVLSKEKIKKDLRIDIPHWEESLQKCLMELDHKL